MNEEIPSVSLSFKPRLYQEPLIKAFRQGYKRLIAICPRRSGKDVVSWNIIIEAALDRVGQYFYVLPTAVSCRSIIWECIMSNGQRMIDFLPSILVRNKNEQRMSLELINGSRITLVGSNNYNHSLVGRGCAGIVFSEFALSDPLAWQYSSPLVAETDGWACFISTVRGKDHLFDLYEAALGNKEWFVQKLTYDDTNHLSPEAWEREKKEHSWDWIQAEYYCDFNLGVEGTIFGKYIDKMNLQERIGDVPFNPRYRVNSAWDIGRDMTAIIWFQIINDNVHCINYYEKSGENMEHFLEVMENFRKENNYNYFKHFFPHDMGNINWDGPKLTRLFKAQQMGLDGAQTVKKVGLEDGIEWTRTGLQTMFIDRKKCKQLIKCLENFRYQFDPEKRVYSREPVHNWASHGSKAMQYLCLGVPFCHSETTPELLRARYSNAMARNSPYSQATVDTIWSDRR